ncbi:ribosomal protein L9 [Batrachochytrium salamandrivorans]|nr:ribosomal protein L9 [Batrachochytrium salamandrivorans]
MSLRPLSMLLPRRNPRIAPTTMLPVIPHGLSTPWLTRSKFTKPGVHVYLMKNVKGLGKQGTGPAFPSSHKSQLFEYFTILDVMHYVLSEPISPSQSTLARRGLVPLKLAYYVPRIRGKPILPENWKPPVDEKDLGIEMITPAFSSETFKELPSSNPIPLPGVTKFAASLQAATENMLSKEEALQQDQERRDTLIKLKPLSFQRVRIVSDSERIFGSVSSYDVSLLLDQVHSIRVDRDTIFLNPQKLKHIGEHDAEIRFASGLESISIKVVISELN